MSKRKLNLTGVLGYPVKHTLSPAIQNAAFKAAGLNYIYLPFEVKPEECAGLFKLLPKLGFKGVNITVPHKHAAYLTSDFVTKEAKISETVNTLKIVKNKLYGTSTDGEGLLRSLEIEAGFQVKGKSIIILGAGGAGRAAAVYFAVKGANRIIIANRSRNKALLAVKLLKKAASKTVAFSVPLKKSIIKRYALSSDLIVNATTIGLKSTDKPILGYEAFTKNILFYDMVYNHKVTVNMREAKKSGAKCLNGLGMLLHQGALAFEFWTKRKAPIKAMKNALIKELKIRG